MSEEIEYEVSQENINRLIGEVNAFISGEKKCHLSSKEILKVNKYYNILLEGVNKHTLMEINNACVVLEQLLEQSKVYEEGNILTHGTKEYKGNGRK